MLNISCSVNVFLSDQCKDIEENNRMGKTRDLFKIIGDTKGIFHAKMGTIKDRNSMDITEAEVDVFLEFHCFLYDSTDVGNLIFGCFAFSKSNLYVSKFSAHVLLKPSLKDFEHYLTSM